MTKEMQYEVSKRGSQWFIWQSSDESAMRVGTRFKTKREALRQLDQWQTHAAQRGWSSSANIYDANGNHKENIMIISRKDTA